MFDPVIEEMLTDIGVSQATQARLDLFTQVPPPESRFAFSAPTPVVVELTEGQVQLLRGAIRMSVVGVLTAHAQKWATDKAYGADPSVGFLTDEGPEPGYVNYLDLEDVLAEAYSLCQTFGEVSIPDTAPDWL